MTEQRKQLGEQRGLTAQSDCLAFKLSHHAQARAAQRCLSTADILYILRYGRQYYAADAIFYFLVGRDVPKRERHQMDRLVGTAIIVNKERTTIITMWRNRQKGSRKIRRKRARTR